MEREDFFSIAGFVSVMGEKLKGFKAIANRILSAKGKEMVLLRFHGAVAARVQIVLLRRFVWLQSRNADFGPFSPTSVGT